MELKLGKLPFEKDDRDLKLAKYVDRTSLPTPPEFTDDYKAFDDWNLFLNSSIGDCAVAGPLHMLMLWNKQGNKDAEFTDENALEVYEDISGYDPNCPITPNPTDKGCVLRDVLKYWRKTGIPDKNGVRHKISGFVQLDHEDHEEIKIAQYLFSIIDIGFMVPAYAMEQFEKGEPWTIQTENDEIEGGHCVVPAGYGAMQVEKVTDEGVWVITWGKAQFMTWKFWDKYVDEAWSILDEDFLVNGKSPDGFDLEQLKKDLAALSGF